MANKETKDLVRLVVNAVNAVGDSLKDGKLNILDAVHFIKVLVSAGPAIDNVSGVLEELKSLSVAEKQEILDMVKEVDLPNEDRELLVERILRAAIVLAEVILPLVKVKAA